MVLSVDGKEDVVYNLAMNMSRSRDLIQQFVLGSEESAKDIVRAHIFGSEPVAPRHSEVWEDIHRTFEVEIRLSGKADITLGDTTFPLVPGDVVLIPAWEPHIITSAAPTGDNLVIQFLPEFLGSRTIGGILWLNFFAMPAASRPRVKPAFRDRVLAVAADIRYEVDQMLLGWDDGVRTELIKLLLILARSDPVDPGATRGLQHRQVVLERVMPAVILAYSEPSTRKTLEEAADACRLSVRHFSSLFKSVMGVSFANFSLRVRLRRAAELLSLTDLPVETIAETTGFTDHSHLSRSFVRLLGTTPGGYRQSPRQR
ncbi:MAG: helix-turn-helix domain-containing protein [Gemmatimonadales bacterium]|nr:helix-turn-helix domain-containing protein [Gemmatimonadales bacterium]